MESSFFLEILVGSFLGSIAGNWLWEVVLRPRLDSWRNRISG